MNPVYIKIIRPEFKASYSFSFATIIFNRQGHNAGGLILFD